MFGIFRKNRIIFVLTIVTYFVIMLMAHNIIYTLEYGIFICPALYILFRKIDFRMYVNLYNKLHSCNIDEFINKTNKLIKSYENKNQTLRFKLSLIYAYIQTNKLEEASKLLENFGNIYNDISYDVFIRSEILLYTCELNLKIKEYAKAENSFNQVKNIIQKERLLESSTFSPIIYHYYLLLDCKIKCLKNDKKTFNDIEEALTSNINYTMLEKVKCADELVTIYEKLGNKEKAKEYAKFLIENHKDYYVDPKRITKYSTLIKKGKL